MISALLFLPAMFKNSLIISTDPDFTASFKAETPWIVINVVSAGSFCK